jgi:hypothetical protein
LKKKKKEAKQLTGNCIQSKDSDGGEMGYRTNNLVLDSQSIRTEGPATGNTMEVVVGY